MTFILELREILRHRFKATEAECDECCTRYAENAEGFYEEVSRNLVKGHAMNLALERLLNEVRKDEIAR